jgi:fluoroacetyl-CoA thioesterase
MVVDGEGMNSDLKPGLLHVQSLRVVASLTVPAVSRSFTSFADMPPVFATAFLVGFVEWACIELLRPYLAPNERSVGTHVDISHVAATPVGMTVTAEVELLEIQGRILRFGVLCRDEFEMIAKGFHQRTIIDHARFLAHVDRKKAGSRAVGP